VHAKAAITTQLKEVHVNNILHGDGTIQKRQPIPLRKKVRPMIKPVFMFLAGALFGTAYAVYHPSDEMQTLAKQISQFMPVDEGQTSVLWLERNKDGVLELVWEKHAMTRSRDLVEISKD
jgi:hypothetical protein